MLYEVITIALLNRTLTNEERASGLSEFLIGYYPIGVIVNENNPVSNITLNQLMGIFTGEITNWAEVGGSINGNTNNSIKRNRNISFIGNYRNNFV